VKSQKDLVLPSGKFISFLEGNKKQFISLKEGNKIKIKTAITQSMQSI
jgi:hypothetical protein